MLFQLAILARLMAMGSAINVVYNANFTKGYVQNTRGQLSRLRVPTKQTNVYDLDTYLTPVTAAPGQAQLVISADGTLLAVWGENGCKKSPIVISEYSDTSDSWTQIATSSENWYQEGAVVWYDWHVNKIYVYGGECKGQIDRGFYEFDVSTRKFAKATASPMPREMAYAKAINLDKSSTVIVGGRASNGWISMQQVAFWEYQSWTYRSVGNYTGIDSRDSPLVLPLWSETVGGDPVVNKLVVIGGSVNHRVAKPEVIVLEFNSTSGWAWSTTNIDGNGSWLTLYDSLVDFDGKDYSLYDSSESWKKAQVMAIPTIASSESESHTPTKSSSKLNVASIATLSTVLPVIAIVIAVVGIWWWWRKRQQRRTFLPRRAVLSPDMASVGFQGPSQYGSPYRSDNTNSDETSVQDVQFLVPNRRQALRVVNPDTESLDGLSSASHRRGRSGQSTQAHTHSRSKSTSSNISGHTLENPFDDKFDFETKS